LLDKIAQVYSPGKPTGWNFYSLDDTNRVRVFAAPQKTSFPLQLQRLPRQIAPDFGQTFAIPAHKLIREALMKHILMICIGMFMTIPAMADELAFDDLNLRAEKRIVFQKSVMSGLDKKSMLIRPGTVALVTKTMEMECDRVECDDVKNNPQQVLVLVQFALNEETHTTACIAEKKDRQETRYNCGGQRNSVRVINDKTTVANFDVGSQIPADRVCRASGVCIESIASCALEESKAIPGNLRIPFHVTYVHKTTCLGNQHRPVVLEERKYDSSSSGSTRAWLSKQKGGVAGFVESCKTKRADLIAKFGMCGR
jgi:hypothetical protein